MSLISRLFGGDITAKQADLEASLQDAPLESWAADSSHLNAYTLASLYGVTPEDMPPTREAAMSIAAVAKGRNLICTSIARMPLVAVKGGAPLASQPPLLRQLSPGTTNFSVLSWIVDGLIFHGRAFLLITSTTPDGRPASVRFVPEGDAETKDGRLIKAFGESVAAHAYIRVDAPHEGILHFGRDVLRTAKEIERVSAEVGASPVPSIVLKEKEGGTITHEEAAELMAAWTASRRKRFGSVGFINKAVDVEAIGQSAENLLIEGLNHNVLQIARLLGLPAHTLDGTVAGTALNYSNQQSRNRELLDALVPYIVAVEQTLSLFLAHGTEVKFDTAELLKPDTKGRYDEYAVAIQAGFLTVDEVRQRENLAPLPQPAPAPSPEPSPEPTSEEETP